MFVSIVVFCWAIGIIGLIAGVQSAATLIVVSFVCSVILLVAQDLVRQGSTNKWAKFFSR